MSYSSNRSFSSNQINPRAIKLGVAGIAIAIGLAWANPFAIVPSGNVGVVITFGKIDPIPLTEGLHLVRPFLDSVKNIETRVRKCVTEGDAASRDLQRVTTKIALNYHLIPGQAPQLLKQVGLDIEQKMIEPAIEEVFKAVTAQYTAEELITKRENVRDRIREMLAKRLLPYGVAIDEFAITNFAFSQAFSDAIEAKTTATQQQLKAETDLLRIRVEAEQKVAEAKGVAEAMRLQKQEVTPELIRLSELKNQEMAIKKWDGRMPSTVAGGAMPFIDVKK